MYDMMQMNNMTVKSEKVDRKSIRFTQIQKRRKELEKDIKEIDENVKKIDQTRQSLLQQKQAMQGALALCDEFLNPEPAEKVILGNSRGK